jgi:hypothetical protein
LVILIICFYYLESISDQLVPRRETSQEINALMRQQHNQYVHMLQQQKQHHHHQKHLIGQDRHQTTLESSWRTAQWQTAPAGTTQDMPLLSDTYHQQVVQRVVSRAAAGKESHGAAGKLKAVEVPTTGSTHNPIPNSALLQHFEGSAVTAGDDSLLKVVPPSDRQECKRVIHLSTQPAVNAINSLLVSNRVVPSDYNYFNCHLHSTSTASEHQTLVIISSEGRPSTKVANKKNTWWWKWFISFC